MKYRIAVDCSNKNVRYKLREENPDMPVFRQHTYLFLELNL